MILRAITFIGVLGGAFAEDVPSWENPAAVLKSRGIELVEGSASVAEDPEVRAISYIRKAPDDIFRVIRSLKGLVYLQIGNLSAAPSEELLRKIAQMEKLEAVELSVAHITHMTPGYLWIWQREWEMLSLRGNPLGRFPSSTLEIAVGARILDLELSSLAKAGGQRLIAPRLEVLTITSCELPSLPDLSHCGRLRKLNISLNRGIAIRLEHLPPEVEDIQASLCRLKDFPIELLKPPKLKQLVLGANRLSTIPWEAVAASSVEFIDLSSNGIGDLGTPVRVQRPLKVLLAENPIPKKATEELVRRFGEFGITLLFTYPTQ